MSQVLAIREQGRDRGMFAGSCPPAPPKFKWTRLDSYTWAIIALFAILTRFIGLSSATASGTPVFDEKHYVPQAWDMVRSWINPVTGGIESNPGYGLVVHPPLAKQIEALGEWVFGYSPLGWRVMAALFGTLTIFGIMAITRRLSGSTVITFIAGILAVADGVLLVSSRFGMLDIFQVLFIVLAAWALIRDHQQMHHRIHNHVRDNPKPMEFGPRFGFRWWRFSSGIFLGLALSVKWSGLYYIAFFGLLSVFLDMWLRKRYGVRRYIAGTFWFDVFPALASLVLVPVLLYIWSWRAWFASETSVYRHAAEDGTIPGSSFLQILPDSIAGWLHYHISVLEFHGSLTTSSGHSHPWDSKPWSWLVAGRPILYFSSTDISCEIGGSCRRMIYLFGTPAIWWLTVPVIIWALWSLIIRKNRGYLVPLVAFAAGFLPWLAAYDRQMYFFYATALVPFTIVLLALACGELWQRGTKMESGLTRGSIIVVVYVAVVLTMFLIFSPLFYGYVIPDSVYESLMWLPSWR
ncbi:dolichyl-phosphate-mannose--protein mannosyltransferase [Corynebacterium callunae]|nr:phospholipid carrier-dependent glycosyltransferase [Corynebacterium callunae]